MDYAPCIWSEDSWRICTLNFDKNVPYQANGHLIAAAPDLQESLLECAEVLELLASVLGTQTHGAALKSDAEDYGACRALERARTAINKSLGREE
ncbi:hypothetical protein [Sphingobacterium mizutaii]|uniref:hypothetical protein n=1 Tax=Sphingobacterium mizutaii TaxID=1010 RepID=UPI00289DD4E3|nr:hypothetical protein [Sphingobacterium mizutaii]